MDLFEVSLSRPAVCRVRSVEELHAEGGRCDLLDDGRVVRAAERADRMRAGGSARACVRLCVSPGIKFGFANSQSTVNLVNSQSTA